MKRLLKFAPALILLLTLNVTLIAQTINPASKLKEFVASYDAEVGVAAKNFRTGEILSLNGEDCFPMQSVYKFPLAIAVLHKIDSSELTLEDKLQITPDDLLPDTWSPLRDKYGRVNVSVSIRELLEFTVTYSDNNACDILFRFLGGPNVVGNFMKVLGINDILILSTEEEMHADDTLQYKNCSTPKAMMHLLEKFYSQELLSEESHDFLWEIMAVKKFGLKRIQGELPADVVVAHKTGTSGTDKNGLAAATNDVGIVVTPSGDAFSIVVFVSDSHENESRREEIIAKVAKMIWDEYISNKENK